MKQWEMGCTGSERAGGGDSEQEGPTLSFALSAASPIVSVWRVCMFCNSRAEDSWMVGSQSKHEMEQAVKFASTSEFKVRSIAVVIAEAVAQGVVDLR